MQISILFDGGREQLTLSLAVGLSQLVVSLDQPPDLLAGILIAVAAVVADEMAVGPWGQWEWERQQESVSSDLLQISKLQSQRSYPDLMHWRRLSAVA